MEPSRLTVTVNGAYWHPLGDVTPIDSRYSETIATEDLPDRALLKISGPIRLQTHLQAPRGVMLENLAGKGLQKQPTDEEAAELARKVLCVGVWQKGTMGGHPIELHPCRPGAPMGQGQFFWLGPGAVISVAPREPGVEITIKITWFPGTDA